MFVFSLVALKACFSGKFMGNYQPIVPRQKQCCLDSKGFLKSSNQLKMIAFIGPEIVLRASHWANWLAVRTILPTPLFEQNKLKLLFWTKRNRLLPSNLHCNLAVLVLQDQFAPCKSRESIMLIKSSPYIFLSPFSCSGELFLDPPGKYIHIPE